MLKYVIKTTQTNTTTIEEINNDDSSSTAQNTESERRQKRAAEVKKKYENEERHRKFCTDWKKAFRWVKLSDDRQKMFCDVCMLYPNLSDKDSKFVKGCSNFHIKSLWTHDKSEAHQKCSSPDKAKKSTPGSTPAEKMIQGMNKIEFQKMQILFRIVHSLAKNGRPFEDFPWA